MATKTIVFWSQYKRWPWRLLKFWNALLFHLENRIAQCAAFVLVWCAYTLLLHGYLYVAQEYHVRIVHILLSESVCLPQLLESATFIKCQLQTDPNWYIYTQIINASPPSAAYMSQLTGSALVKVMACRLRCQAVIWIIAGLVSFGLLGTNFSKNWIGIPSFSLKNMHFKLSSAKVAVILSRGRWVKAKHQMQNVSWAMHLVGAFCLLLEFFFMFYPYPSGYIIGTRAIMHLTAPISGNQPWANESHKVTYNINTMKQNTIIPCGYLNVICINTYLNPYVSY